MPASRLGSTLTRSGTRPYRLSLSIGFSHYPGGSEESLADMLFATDQRMYARQENWD